MVVGGEDGFDLVARDVGGWGVVGLENGFGGGDGEEFAGEEGVVGPLENVGAGGGREGEKEGGWEGVFHSGIIMDGTMTEITNGTIQMNIESAHFE